MSNLPLPAYSAATRVQTKDLVLVAGSKVDNASFWLPQDALVICQSILAGGAPGIVAAAITAFSVLAAAGTLTLTSSSGTDTSTIRVIVLTGITERG